MFEDWGTKDESTKQFAGYHQIIRENEKDRQLMRVLLGNKIEIYRWLFFFL